MRLGLLSLISWMVTLTTPLFSVGGFSFAGRDLILLAGGLFLLFKAAMELHERLGERVVHHTHGGNHSIQREDGVQYHNLRHDSPETGISPITGSVELPVLQPLVQLHGRLAGCCDYRRGYGEPPAGDDDRRGDCDGCDAAGV